jgi:hypothetical protein
MAAEAPTINHGTGRCITFGGFRVDQAIAREILRVLRPAAIEAALTTATAAAEETAVTERALALELREARYEAERAQRQYDAVEPEHRLVAATLEQRRNTVLDRVHRLEQRLAALQAEADRRALPDRATLLRVAEDFPQVWADRTTDVRTKKRIVRLVIEEILAKALVEPQPHIELVIHWVGGKHTRLLLPRNRTGQHRRCTDRAIVEVVQDLARRLPDGQVARVLNRLGYRTGVGNGWTQGRVASLRGYHRIRAFERTTDRTTTLTIDEAAPALGVSTTTVRRLIARAPRARRLLEALGCPGLTFRAFSQAELRAVLVDRLGVPPAACPAAQLAYDLRQLRGKGVVWKADGRHRYTLTDLGYRVVVSCTKLPQRLLTPILDSLEAAARPAVARSAHPVDRALTGLNDSFDHLAEVSGLNSRHETPKKFTIQTRPVSLE